MLVYRVAGELPYTKYCVCPDCDGHTGRKKVDELIEATSAKAAMLLAAVGSDLEFGFSAVDEADIDDLEELAEALTVTEAPPDLAMAALGMPTLFDTEAAP